MKVKSESEVAQSCPTPSDPMDCSTPGSSIHGIFQARVLEWGATAFSKLRDKTLSFISERVNLKTDTSLHEYKVLNANYMQNFLLAEAVLSI